MRSLESKLSKLETLAGIGLSPMEQFQREVNSRSDAELLAAYYWIKAQIAGITPPAVSDGTVSLVQRLCSLMPSAG